MADFGCESDGSGRAAKLPKGVKRGWSGQRDGVAKLRRLAQKTLEKILEKTTDIDEKISK